ncbi:unnamed protein product [Caenorhabditis angaria]|uniref:Uncharacterized protein n=1 Tax=Caenorhabditis angaria TaxID=860376 RepID=A0A9P1IV29_9PELO|nr:unnamed protein product [Caenorhabditis angaria]
MHIFLWTFQIFVVLKFVENFEDFRIEHVKLRKNRVRREISSSSVDRRVQVARNVTNLLNDVLLDYDHNFRPGLNSGRPTKVYIDLFIRTMGPVADLGNTYSFNCYFRQKWKDDRLQIRNNSIGLRQLSLSNAMLDRIWKPDTYFWNGARSYVHTITTPNRLVRLETDGSVLYSSRITVKAKCSMDMSRYPLDKQACRLILGSYAYTAQEVQYEWRKMGEDRGVKIDYESIADLPQFSLTGFKIQEPANFTRDLQYSALEVRFFFDRHFGYFLMNFYVPCALVVLLLWVAFFTKREATAERIGIGITNVLTIVLISLDSKTDSPKVDSPTALDVYIWICYVAHLFCDPEIQEVERERIRQIIKQIPKKKKPGPGPGPRPRPEVLGPTPRRNRFMSVRNPVKSAPIRKISHMEKFEVQDGPEESGRPENLEFFRQENVGWRLYTWMMDHNIKTDPFGVAQNSISRIDKISVFLAPLIFGLTLVFYYDFYVNRPFEFNFDNNNFTRYI